MKAHRPFSILLFFTLLATATSSPGAQARTGPHSPAANDISLQAGSTYQTMSGWEAVAWAAQDSPAFPNYRDELFDRAVNEVGINRVRLEVRSGAEHDNDNWTDYQNGVIDYPTWRSRRYATVNDNADPDSINWGGFYFSELDDTVEKVVLPLKQRVEANGGDFLINLNYVAFTGQIGPGLNYDHDDPDEYAEFVLATYLHLQSKYGLAPDMWEVLLEPDNVSQWDGTLLGEAMVAAASKLQAHGFTPRFVAPSNTNMGNAITYFDAMILVPGALTFLEEFSYHRYGGVSDANLQAIANRAVLHGLDTSMLEWWSSSNGYQTLHKDLEMGRNSAWEQGVLGGPGDPATSSALYAVDDSDPANPVVHITNMTKFTRQYFRFIQPGAVRIGATSNNASLSPLAFVDLRGCSVVVVKAGAGATFNIHDLPAGIYGVQYTTASQYSVDAADIWVGAGEMLTTSIPAAGVITAYSKTTAGCGELIFLPILQR